MSNIYKRYNNNNIFYYGNDDTDVHLIIPSTIKLYGFHKATDDAESLDGDESDTVWDGELKLDRKPYKISVLLKYVQQQCSVDVVHEKADLYIGNTLCVANEILDPGKTLNIVRKDFCKYRITFLTYGRHSQALASTLDGAQNILNENMHLFQIGYIESIDWKDRVIETVQCVVKPKTKFLNRKRPCEALRDFEIDIGCKKKYFAYTCNVMQTEIQAQTEKRRLEKEARLHRFVLKDLYGSDEEEDFEEFLKNNAYP